MTLEVDPTQTSRVELEHLALSLIAEGGQDDDVEAIRAELASRTWQNHNPYALTGGAVIHGPR
jgi:hypothetical protein